MKRVKSILVAVVAIMCGCVKLSAVNTVIADVRTDSVVNRTDSVMTDTIDRNLQLKELVVNGQKVLRYPDKDVWIISKSMRKYAFDVIEMLGNIPGMYYDRFEKKLRCNGSDNIKILMDGKEKPSGYVENMAHLRFRRVEVIPYPTGVYRDYDVLINLISYEHYEGLELTVKSDAEVKPEQDEKLSQATPKMTTIYTREKLNLAVSYDCFYYANQAYDIDIQRLYPDYELFASKGDEPVKNNHTVYHNAYIDGDYDINKKHSVSFRYGFTNSRSRMREAYMVDKMYTSPEIPNTLRKELTYTRDNGNSHAATFYYRGEVKGWNLYSDFNYNYNVSDNTYEFDEENGVKLFTAYHNLKHFTRLNISATKTLANKATFNLGYVNVYRYYKSDNGDETSNSDEFRHQFFAALQYSFSDKLRGGVKGNLDAVRSQIGSSYENQWLWNVNANVRYNIKGYWNYISLGYNCNVFYPNQAQLNPIGYKTGYGVWIMGNPELKANMTHSLNVDFSYGFSDYLNVSLTPSLSYNEKDIHNVITKDGNDNIVMTYRNIKRVTSNLNMNVFGWIFLQPNRKGRLSYGASVNYVHKYYKLGAFDMSARGGKWYGNVHASYVGDLTKTSFYSLSIKYSDNGRGNTVSSLQSRSKDELRSIRFGGAIYLSRWSFDISYHRPLKQGGHNIFYSETITPYYSTYVWSNMFESEHKIELTLRWRFATGKQTRKKDNGQYIESENNNLLK